MEEKVNIPQMSDEQRELMSNDVMTNIMDIASEEMTAEQEHAVQTLAEAKAASVENIVGAEQIPTFRFTKTRPVVRDYKIGRNDPSAVAPAVATSVGNAESGTAPVQSTTVAPDPMNEDDDLPF